MDFDAVGKKLDALLYRKIFQKLTPEDLASAKTWCLEVLRKNHPTWSEADVQKDYDNLINVKVIVVDEWSRRMQ